MSFGRDDLHRERDMAKENIANWTKTKNGWQIIVTLHRHWEAPDVGQGLGREVTAKIVKKGQYASQVRPQTLILTSRVFERDGNKKAFAKEA